MVYTNVYDTIVDGPPCLIFSSDNESNVSSSKLANPKMNTAKSSSLAPPPSATKQRKSDKMASATMKTPQTTTGHQKKTGKSGATPGATNTKTNHHHGKPTFLTPAQHKHNRAPKLDRQTQNTAIYPQKNTLAVPTSPYINEKQQLSANLQQQQQHQPPLYSASNVVPPPQASSSQVEVPMAFKVAGNVWDYLKQVFNPPQVTTVLPDINTIQNTAIPGQLSPNGTQFPQNVPPPYSQQAPQRSPAPAMQNLNGNRPPGVPLGSPLIAPPVGVSPIPPQQFPQQLPQFPQQPPQQFPQQPPQQFYSQGNPLYSPAVVPTSLGLVPGAAFGTPLIQPGSNNTYRSPLPAHQNLIYPAPFAEQPKAPTHPQQKISQHNKIPTPELVGFPDQTSHINYDQMYQQIIDEHNRFKDDISDAPGRQILRQNPIDIIRSASTPIFILIASILALSVTSSTVPSTNFFQQFAGYINSLIRTCAMVGALVSAVFLGIKFIAASSKTKKHKKESFNMKFVAGQPLDDGYDQTKSHQPSNSPFMSPHFFPSYAPIPPNQHFYPNQPPAMNFVHRLSVPQTVPTNMIPVTPQTMPAQIPTTTQTVTPQVQIQPPTVPSTHNRSLSGSSLQIPPLTPLPINPGTPDSSPGLDQLFPGMLTPEPPSSAKSSHSNPPQMKEYLSKIGVSSATDTPLTQTALNSTLNTPTPYILQDSNRAATPAPAPQPAQTPTPLLLFPQTPNSALSNIPISTPSNILNTPLQIPEVQNIGPSPAVMPVVQPMPNPEKEIQASNKGYVKHFSFVPAGTILDDMKYNPDEKIDPAKLRYFDLADDKLRNDLKEELLLRSNNGHILMPPLPNIDDPSMNMSNTLNGMFANFPLDMELIKENLPDRGLMGEKLPPIDYKKMYELFEKRLDGVSMKPANATQDKDGPKNLEKKEAAMIKSILKTPTKIKSATLPGDAILDDYYVDDYSCKPYGPPPTRYRPRRV